MKLSNEKRDRIVSHAVEILMKKRQERLKTEEDAIAVFVYNQLYPPEIQNHMGHLPDEFFSSQSHLYVNYFNRPHQINMKVSRKVSARDQINYHTPCLKMEGDSIIRTRVQKLLDGRDKLAKDTKELREKLKSLLYNINTDKQLQAQWPEGLRFYKKFIEEPLPNPPAVQTGDVNALISQLEQEEI